MNATDSCDQLIKDTYYRCISAVMKITGDDYSDLVTYLTGLFSIKKIQEILVDRFRMRYESCFVLNGAETDEGALITRFPEDDERDRIKYVTFSVSGLKADTKSTVRINWDSVEITPDIDMNIARDYIDVLDRSTFRYF